jgi:TolA-binding protein
MKAPIAIATAIGLTLGAAPANAQRPLPTPEQRIERLERQLGQVSRQVFPRGAPAATAGFADEPAATQTSVRSIDERVSALQRQLADILRQSEENGFRLRQMETELGRLRSDQEQRIAALEAARAAPAIVPAPVIGSAEPAVVPARPVPATPKPALPTSVASTTDTDPAEGAYDVGYQLWKAGQYDNAITSLRAFVVNYPKHRRTSWANNLIGRALLDKGEARAAAEALLSNYRSNPKGERAGDSLYYLGQSLVQLGQPGQACKAYSELENVYGKAVRADLQKLVATAKAEAKCS